MPQEDQKVNNLSSGKIKSSNHSQLVVEPTHLKNISHIGPFPQVGINIKNV